jgi:hypothetical protein
MVGRYEGRGTGYSRSIAFSDAKNRQLCAIEILKAFIRPDAQRISIKKKLGRDVLSVISRLFADGEEFSGHDGRQYAIIGINAEETESESFVDVAVKLNEGRRMVAKFAIILQQISR